MIPNLVQKTSSPWAILPAGVHQASLAEVSDFYGINPIRRRQFRGFERACKALAHAGCRCVYLDGSYVSGKPRPGDYDACWDPSGVSINKLDPTFLDYSNKRSAQKLKYEGEFFPFGNDAGNGQPFLDFFQTDRFSAEKKGILAIDLTKEVFGFADGAVQ